VEAGQANILLDSSMATASSSSGTGCVICGVTNLDAILDPNPDNFATANVDVALLNALGEQVDMGAELIVSASLNSLVDPTVEAPIDPTDPTSPLLARSQPGFVISFPDVNLLALSVMPTISISTLREGAVVGGPRDYGFGVFDFLAAATVLQDINNAQVFVGVDAGDEPYDEIRFTVSGTIVDVFVPINIHQTALHGFPGSISGDF